MTRIADRDVLDVVDAIYEAACEPVQWAHVADRCRQLVPGSSFGLVSEHSGKAGGQLAIASGWDPDFIASYAAYYHTVNTYQNILATISPGEVSVASTIIDPKWRSKQQFYQEWLKPAGNYTGGASVWLVRNNGTNMRLSYDLPERYTKHEARAAQTLERLKAHFTRSLELESVLSGATGVLLPTDALLEQIDEAAIVVNGDARTVYCNARALAMLQRNDVAGSRVGQLFFKSERADQAFRGCLASATSTIESTSPAAFFAGLYGRRSLRAIVLPLRSRAVLSRLGSTRRLALVLIDDGSEDKTSLSGLLKKLFGLTAAECRLAISLLDGGTLAETADRIGIARTTARNQLASAMSKLGVRKQAEVVRVISTLAPRLRVGHEPR